MLTEPARLTADRLVAVHHRDGSHRVNVPQVGKANSLVIIGLFRSAKMGGEKIHLTLGFSGTELVVRQHMRAGQQ